MPARFRIYDSEDLGDRYFIIDTQPLKCGGELWWDAKSFSSRPYGCTGIGVSTQLQTKDYYTEAATRFRKWGKRIAGNDLNEDGRKLVLEFMQECGGSRQGIHTAMTMYQRGSGHDQANR